MDKKSLIKALNLILDKNPDILDGLNLREYNRLPLAKCMPEKCKGCGICCKGIPIQSISPENYELWSKKMGRCLIGRGLSFREINGRIWVTSPPCTFLNNINECILGDKRPKEALDYPPGCDDCLRMLYFHNEPTV